MHHITLHKTETPRHYAVVRDGQQVGYVRQYSPWDKWEVLDDRYRVVSEHSTIKTAVRIARGVL